MLMLGPLTGVATLHPEYMRRRDQWQRARDVAAGSDAVKGAETKYLPRLSKQSDASYKAMLNRGSWYGASWRTISGCTGMMFRKPPTIKAPEDILELFKEVDGAGMSIEAFARDLAIEVLTVGRVGVLNDYPARDPNTQLTKIEAQALGLRPTMKKYITEDIINWKHRTIKNRTVLSMVVLKEKYVIPTDKEFEEKKGDQWRVLDLDMLGYYRQRVFRKRDDRPDEDYQFGPTVYPRMDGQAMDFIPFYAIGPDGLDICPYEPPLLDLFDLNLDHFRVTVDYENGCHYTAFPTAVVSGYTPQPKEDGSAGDNELEVGSPYAWVFPDPNAKANYLEFHGTGLSEIRANLDRKEAQMAVLGARMLAAEKKQAETATTTAIHRSGENSVLAALAEAISAALTHAAQVFAKWNGSSEECVVKVNTDFMPVIMDTSMITGLLKVLQAGKMSFDTFYRILQRADLADPEKTMTEEIASIKKDIEDMPVITPPTDLNEPGDGPTQPGPQQKAVSG